MAAAPVEAVQRIGTLVENPIQMGWGPGRIVGTKGRNVWVVFRDHPGREAKLMAPDILKPAASQKDPILDNLPEPSMVNGRLVLAGDRTLFEDAVRGFVERYPEGFNDSAYMKGGKEGERAPRWTAHERFEDGLGKGELRRLVEGGRRKEALVRIREVIGGPGLLVPLERTAFADALKDAASAEAMLRTLADVVEATEATEETFAPFLDAVSSLASATEMPAVASWSIATLLPALGRPDAHVFVKPAVAQKAARGFAFDLKYKASLNWTTYERILLLASIYRQKLVEMDKPNLAPRDLVDVTAFILSAAQGGAKSRVRTETSKSKIKKAAKGLLG